MPPQRFPILEQGFPARHSITSPGNGNFPLKCQGCIVASYPTRRSQHSRNSQSSHPTHARPHSHATYPLAIYTRVYVPGRGSLLSQNLIVTSQFL